MISKKRDEEVPEDMRHLQNQDWSLMRIQLDFCQKKKSIKKWKTSSDTHVSSFKLLIHLADRQVGPMQF